MKFKFKPIKPFGRRPKKAKPQEEKLKEEKPGAAKPKPEKLEAEKPKKPEVKKPGAEKPKPEKPKPEKPKTEKPKARKKIKLKPIKFKPLKLDKLKKKLAPVAELLTRPLVVTEHTATGLDIGTRYLKLVQIKKKPQGYILEKYGIIGLPPEVIVDREFMDREVLIENLRNLIKESGIEEVFVSIPVAGKNVILKKLESTLPKRREFPKLIKKLARENIPFDLKDVTIDSKKLKEEKDKLELVLIGAKNEVVYPLIDAIKDAELLPYNIDIAPFALQAAYQANGYIEPKGAYLLVSMGFEHTLIVIIRDGCYFFDDEIPIGVRTFIEEIQRTCGISAEDAAKILQGEEVKEVASKDVSKAIQNTLSRLLERVERMIPETLELKNIILGGGGATIPGLEESFAEKFNTKCEIGNPVKTIECIPDLPESPHTLDLAIGLAISRLENIGINLLPLEERIREKNKLLEAMDVNLPFYCSLITVLILAVITFSLTRKQRSIESDIKTMEAQQEQLKAKAQMVRQMMIRERDISRKVKVVQDLGRHKYARIKLIDEVNRLVPAYTWLIALNETSSDSVGINLLLRGITTSNFAVSNFLQRLEESPYFSNIKLSHTKRGEMAETKTTEFEITAQFIERFL